MIIKTKREEFESYLEDTSNLKGEAFVLYLPEKREEVEFAVKELVEKKIEFTVSGGRTGTTAGCVPSCGAVFSLEKLNKIIDLDRQKNIVVAEAGVSLDALEKELNQYGLTLRAMPTEGLAFTGGAISTGASGVRGFKYGSIRNYVAGLEVVLPKGEVLNIQRGQIFSKKRTFDFNYENRRFKFILPSYNMPKVKSQAGYFVKDNIDLIDLFIGSEGVLGVITSCRLFVQPMPFNVFDGLIFFKKENRALDFVDKIKDLKNKRRLIPASLEFFDTFSLEILRQHYSFVPLAVESAVYFEQEAEDERSYDDFLSRWMSLIEESGASLDNSIIADTVILRKKVFEFRHRLPQLINEFLRSRGQIKASADIAVPADRLREMYSFYKKTAQKSGIKYVNFGHIGESHLHFNFFPENTEESRKAGEFIRLFCQKACSWSGTVSAEHGIGKIKKPYLKIMYTDDEIKEMVAVKKYFDPAGLLNLDNIFDRKLLG